ncbi:MAG: ABC transporter ATP-binding protein [Anaerorhabdus sp.]
MSVIEIMGLTKDYGEERGIFDLSFSVEKGEIFGFLGPNGAGKTTTIRHLLNFIHSDKGSCSILQMDCKDQSKKIQEKLGYLPGEIAFMGDMTGMQFIHFVAKMKQCKDLAYANELMERFELNPHGKIKKMSKGMKQKIGIVCAFMTDPEVLILDEPTSGLDPLMQNKFVELILEEKAKGKTILMSSHMFEEVEKTCDRFAMIKNGKLISLQNMKQLREEAVKTIKVTFFTEDEAFDFASKVANAEKVGVVATFELQGELTDVLKQLTQYRVMDLSITTPTLEERFVHYYGGKAHV